MANWLSRAQSLFQQQPLPPPPEPFEVECDCGMKVVGVRTMTSQRPNCQTCHRPVFVLPANVYPQSKLKPKDAGKSKKKTTEGTSASLSTNTVTDAPSKAAPPADRASPKITVKPPIQETAIIETTMIKEPARPLLTPLNIAIIAILLISALMVGGVWYRYRVEKANSVALSASKAGMAALKQNDFSTAAKELDRAKTSVDLLGRTDSVANDIRRFSREATAIDKLATGSLTEILEQSLPSTTTKAKEPPRIPGIYHQAWIIFDVGVISANKNENRFVIDGPIQFPQGNVAIQITTAIFKKLPLSAEPDIPFRVIFAAQLEQLSSPIGEPQNTVLTLNGNSAFLWTSYETYSAAGYRPIDEESEQQTRAVLERQFTPLQK